MTIVPGKVVNGRIEVEDDIELPEGAEVTVYLHEEGEYVPTPEEEAELEAACDEADRGEGVPLEDVLRELREMRESFVPPRR